MIKLFLLIGIVSAGVSYLGKWMENSAKYYEETKEFSGVMLGVVGVIVAVGCLILIVFTLLGVV